MRKSMTFDGAIAITMAMAMVGVTGAGAQVSAQRVYPLDTLHVSVSSRLGGAAGLRAVDVIDRAMIERLPTRSVADAIARALGADVMQRSPAQADLSLRGSTTEQVLVLIDGVAMNDTQTGHFHLDQAVPLDQIERIEVMRGAASSVHGTNAVGGIVNIVTRANGAQSNARIEGGTFGTIAASAGVGVRLRNTTPLDISVEHERSDGHRAGTDYRNTVARGTLTLPVDEGRLRIDVGNAERDFGASQFYGPFPTSYEETRVITGGISYDRTYGSVRIEPRATIRKHYDDFVLRRENPAFYHNEHRTTDAGGGLVVRVPVAGVQTAFGGETFNSTVVSSNLKNHHESHAAVFGEALAGAGRRATLSAGLRLDDNSTFGSFLSPSAAAGFRVSDGVRVRASAARGFRAPTWTDRYYSDPANRGDSTLKAEEAWSYEAGVDATPAAGWRVDGTGFVRRVTNAIDWVKPAGAPASTPWQIINIQDATFRGIELRLQGAPVLGVDWTVRASALSFEADSAAGFTSKYALRPLTETASLEVVVPLPAGFELGVIGSHLRRSGDDAYHLLDAQVGYRWRSCTFSRPEPISVTSVIWTFPQCLRQAVRSASARAGMSPPHIETAAQNP